MANRHQVFNVAIEITKQYARGSRNSKEPALILQQTYEMHKNSKRMLRNEWAVKRK